MAKSTTGHTDRTRPSSRLKPQSLLDSTPVLFRLPAIQLNILAGSEEEDTEVGQAVADRHGVVENPGQSLPKIYTDVSQGVELASIAAEQSKATADDRILKTDSMASTRSALDTPSESQNSWWEHWSSGVVVILIAIAILTVILLFVRSSGSSAQSSLRSQALEDEFGDLELISVPTFEMVAPSLTTASLPESTEDRMLSDSTSNEYSELAAQLASVDVSSSDVSSSGVSQPAAASLTASKTEPIEPDQHISRSESIDESASSEIPTNLPIITAGTPSQNVALGSLATAQLLEPTPLLDSVPASEPFNTSSQETTESALALQYPDLPPISSSTTGNITSSMPNLSGQKSSIPTTATAISAKQFVSEDDSSARPKVRTTATPDSNEEEIIRAYLELIRTDRNSGNTSSEAINRYQGVR